MTRCPKCPGEKTCVGSDGPSPCDLLGIGEAPGVVEDKKGLPFQGRTGDELNRGYLPIIGRTRNRIRITNAIHCLPVSYQGRLDIKREKDLALLEACATHHLYPEIRQVKPRVLLPMGAFACRAIDPDIDLEMHHGIPLDTPRGLAFPQYHPAGGLHEPKKMLQIRTDWVRLDKLLKNKLVIPSDEYAGQEDYREIESIRSLDAVLHQFTNEHLAIDTETMRGGTPFCLTFSCWPGSGYLIRANNKHVLLRFQYWLDRWRGLILFHNWLFDNKVLDLMGLKVAYRRTRDTMMMSFHLGNLPQGLKLLAYREMGMTMKDFDDLVTPHSIPRVLDYYRDAYTEEWETPEPQVIRDPEGKWKAYRPQSFHAKLKRFFGDYSKNPSKDIFEMWTKNWEDLHKVVEMKCGKWPGKCISYAAEKDWPGTIHYACRDADATGRLYPILAGMRRMVRKRSQEFWREAV